jgi:NAD(P)-dependent dehydrogenase (short-subunit alcohol dehydrogenase family)
VLNDAVVACGTEAIQRRRQLVSAERHVRTASARERTVIHELEEPIVLRIFITGSTDGLGRAAARALINDGHRVLLHARSHERESDVADLASRSDGIVIGDLRSAVETRRVAEQVNATGHVDAVIHNAGIYLTAGRAPTAEGHASSLAVNTLAPYMLTALIERPQRLVYLSSGMHRGGAGSLRDIDWMERRWDGTRAYSESKLHVVALALAVARHWPEVLSNAVDPGWVPTKMGGPGAPDDLEMGHLTQTWLAVSDDPAAKVTGRYWHHRQTQTPAAEASDPQFQDRLMAQLEELTGVTLF